MHNNAFTITVRNGGRKLNVVGPMKNTNTRPDQMLALLEGISKWLPDMNITITGHDSPWVMISGEAKEKHIAAAKAGRCELLFLSNRIEKRKN